MNRILVSPEKKTGEVSPSLYGIFFEDINRAGDGGLYAEMLMNRAFDDGVIPQGCVYDGAAKTITSPTGWVSAFPCAETEGVYGWSAQNGARMALTERDTLNASRKRGLEIHFCGGAVLNSGFDGLFLKSGADYRFYMFAKSEHPVEVTISLVSASGTVCAKQAVTVEGCFAKYECVLKSSLDDQNALLALSSPSSDTVTLGFTSLFPADTFMRRENGLRKDLAEMLLALKPAFLSSQAAAWWKAFPGRRLIGLRIPSVLSGSESPIGCFGATTVQAVWDFMSFFNFVRTHRLTPCMFVTAA